MFQKQYQIKTKAEIIEQYKQDYNKFLTTFSKFSPKYYSTKIIENWGIKEILAHIASWDLETIKAIQTVKQGKIPWFFDRKNKIDAFNFKEVSKRKHTSIANILAEIEINHNRLIDFLEQLPNSHWHQNFGKTWRQQKVTPALVCSYRHYAAHTQDILKHVEKQKKSPFLAHKRMPIAGN